MPSFQRISVASIWISWLIFFASFLLPAYDDTERAGSPPGTPLLGWQAMVDSIMVCLVKFWVVLAEPRYLVFIMAPLFNLFVFVSPLLIRSLEEYGWLIATPLVACSVVMGMTMPAEVYAHTLYGFWFWILSPCAIAAGAILYSVEPVQATTMR